MALRPKHWARQEGLLLPWDHMLGGSREKKAGSASASNKGSEKIKRSKCAGR